MDRFIKNHQSKDLEKPEHQPGMLVVVPFKVLLDRFKFTKGDSVPACLILAKRRKLFGYLQIFRTWCPHVRYYDYGTKRTE